MSGTMQKKRRAAAAVLAFAAVLAGCDSRAKEPAADAAPAHDAAMPMRDAERRHFDIYRSTRVVFEESADVVVGHADAPLPTCPMHAFLDQD